MINVIILESTVGADRLNMFRLSLLVLHQPACTVTGMHSRVDIKKILYHGWYNQNVLPDLQLNDIVRLRKPHPCGSYEWKVVRLGADIGLECLGCAHRVMLTRRELSKRLKAIRPGGTDASLPS